MIEHWRSIEGKPEYQVSDRGRVRRVMPRGTWHIIKASQNNHGYLKVCLGRSRQEYVHTLVLSAFVGPRPAGMEVDHYNFDPHDNRLENLRWLPAKVNKVRQRRYGATAA